MTIKRSLMPFLALAAAMPLYTGCQTTRETGSKIGGSLKTAASEIVDFFDFSATYVPKSNKEYETIIFHQKRAMATWGPLDHSR